MNELKNITIIGVGLLGGSMALALKDVTDAKISGIDKSKANLEKALALGIIDDISDETELNSADLVVIAIPTNKIAEETHKVLDLVNDQCIVFDTGSTKFEICQSLKKHPKRQQFAAVHPIAGTEFSGPEAAFKTLFKGKKNIICDPEDTDEKSLEVIIDLFNKLSMDTFFMDSDEHDKHLAYVSHLSHVSSFMLGKTVLEIEKDHRNIFNLAGSGFASTVRLAKSSPETWTSIFLDNKQHLLKALDEYIKNLKEFADLISNDNFDQIYHCISNINKIKNIIK